VPKLISSPVESLKPVGSRFGFHNGSSIDSLLDKEDVSLEAILDEDDLLQECKAQNTRLIDYFQRSDVLQRLLGYVTGQIEGEDRGRFKCVAGQYFLAPSNLSLSYLTKVPLRCNRGSLQRNMVDRRDMSEQHRPVISPLLGDCAGSYTRRHENPNDHGFSICKD
jgi:hypothetical protein